MGWDSIEMDWQDPDEGRTATEAEAHVEWNLNAGVPMGQPGCPWDACHLPDDHEDDQRDYAEEAFNQRILDTGDGEIE